MRQKPRNKCADITQYRNTYLILAHLLECLRMLQLHYIALDDIECPWLRVKNCHTLLQNLTFSLQKLIFSSPEPKAHKVSL